MTRRPSGPGKQRRSLSAARAGGRVERGGDRALAAGLAEALGAARGADEMAESLTHPVHSYPARMHPATASALIELCTPPRGALLDPFCGGGTTLIEGRHAGARVVGVDANPLAVLIARAKTWTAPRRRREQLARAGRDLVTAALAEGRAARRSGYTAPRPRAPRGIDPATRNRRIGPWFSPHVRRELEFVAAAIDDVRAGDAELADILLVLLSAILYKVSRRASDTDPSRVERAVARGQVARLLGQRLEILLAGLDELSDASTAPRPVVHLGDARRLAAAGIADASFDAVVTSPPYAGTYDYVEQHRLRLDFLGIGAKQFAAAEIGARRELGARDAGVRQRALRGWARDLAAAVAEMARALRPGGCAALAVGDSVAGGRAVWADEAVRAACGDALELVAWAAQERPKLGERERHAFGTRPKREHLLMLRRR